MIITVNNWRANRARRLMSSTSPQNITPWRMCVRLYGSRKSFDVSELQAWKVPRKRGQPHHHHLPSSHSPIAVAINSKPITTNGQIILLVLGLTELDLRRG